MCGRSMESISMASMTQEVNGQHKIERREYFQMPLHYPRYKKWDMTPCPPEWKLEYCLLNSYGLPIIGDVEGVRKSAIGHFLWSK
ncbi:hypothetical protein RchiOBHm_Chr1g0358811 [Rosa chinensis]|uniref:DUF7722 domain-containing protein n=1 Tax=Rosa chinensis TaxID=74649 RepID=A0A2P6SI87_ROSCH|nr:hypothetical protein RchiOBHm_Chr1g0358811 [Rosa chinensis]